MKHIIFVFSFAVSLLITACSAQADKIANPAAMEVAEAVAASQPDPSVYTTKLENEDCLTYLQNLYGLDPELLEDAAILYANGVQAYEVAVLQLQSSSDSQEMIHSLQEYRLKRFADFNGYAPEQAAILERAGIVTTYNSKYVALLVCEDPDTAQSAFDSCFRSASLKAEHPTWAPIEYDANQYVVFNPPNVVDMTIYETQPILSAYRTGDASSLTEKDAAILEVCHKVIAEVIHEDMSEYEKELAIHDWLLLWGRLDEGIFHGHGSKDNNNPYGVLVEQKARCLGMATTFQLFMDLLNIRGQIVVGASTDSHEDHAWNIVLLDDEWYCVDLAWEGGYSNDERTDDEILALKSSHRYFNVTSNFMRESDHQWDYEEVPEAAGTKYAYRG